MSTPDKKVGAKYLSMESAMADETCKQDEFERRGGDVLVEPEPGRFMAGMDTWKHGLFIVKLERDGSPRQGHFNWISVDHFGNEAPDSSPELMKRCREALDYSKTREPNYDYRVYRMSFKSGVQRLV